MCCGMLGSHGLKGLVFVIVVDALPDLSQQSVLCLTFSSL